MRMKANLLHKPINFQMDDCLIEKVVELSYEEFSALKIVPLQDQPFIAENKGCMFSRDGIAHCMLALGEGYHDGVLIDAEGYNRAQLAAYIVGARDIVNAELDRAVERIVLEGTENTSNGNWIVYFDELAESLGLVLRPGNGLYEMLEDKMHQRPEILDVEMHPDCIDVIYGFNFCPNLDEEQKEPLSILPERKAVLFDNALSAVLDLYEGDDLFIMLHDSIGLTLEEIGTHHYLREDDLQDLGPLSRKIVEDGLCVRELLQLDVPGMLQTEELSDKAFLINDGHSCCFSLDDARWLAEREETGVSTLLDARVTDIETAPNGSTNIILSGVTMEEMLLLHDAVQTQLHAGRSMEPVM